MGLEEIDYELERVSKSVFPSQGLWFFPRVNYRRWAEREQPEGYQLLNIKTEAQFILSLYIITRIFSWKCADLHQAGLEVVEASKYFADKTKALQFSSLFCEVLAAACNHAEWNKFSISLLWL